MHPPSDDSLSSDEEEYLDCLNETSDAYRLAMSFVASEDTRAGDRVKNLDQWGDDEAYKLFHFRTAELQRLVDGLRLPDIIRVRRSKYTKLEAILCILLRFGTAGQR